MEGMLQTLVLLIYNVSGDKSSRSFIVEAKTKFHSKKYLINHLSITMPN